MPVIDNFTFLQYLNVRTDNKMYEHCLTRLNDEDVQLNIFISL